MPVVEEYLQQKRKGIHGGILLVLRIILQGVLPYTQPLGLWAVGALTAPQVPQAENQSHKTDNFWGLIS